MASLHHRLSAVWFADLVGYSRLAGEDEAAAFRLIQLFQSASRAAAERHEGRVVKFLGDGALAEFPSTEAAVRAAHALLAAFEARSRGLGAGAQTLRIGVHVGDVGTTPDGDLYGDGVNVAARLQAEAEPGQVVVSEDVWRQLRPRRELRFEPLGERTLKGIAAPVLVYAVEVVEELLEETAPAAVSPSAPGPSRDLWGRARSARLVRVLALYVAVAAIIFLGTNALRDALGLPSWVSIAALALLAIGLGIVMATAWVQTRPAPGETAAEAPGKWELALGQLGRSITRGELPHLTWGRTVLGGIFAFSLLFGIAGLYVVIKDRGRSFSPGEAIAEAAAPGIAVLPFRTSGADLDVWREGVIDLVSTNLDGAAGLRAIDSRTVLARWGERVQGGGVPDLATALEVARSAGARYALLGNVTALGPEIRLTADVYDVAGSKKLGQAQAQGAPDSVYMLVDRLSIGVLQTILGGQSEDLPRVDLASVTTPSLPALKAFLEGEVLYRRGVFEAAIPAYQRAVEADSTFALALFRLGTAYGWSETVSSDLANEYTERAARFADRLPEREALLVRGSLALLRANLDGIPALREGVRKYPDDPEMWYMLGDSYNHLGEAALVPREEERHAFDRAIALDPSFSPAYIHPIEYAIQRSDSAAARSLLDRYGRLAKGSHSYDELWIGYSLAWGNPSERERAEAMLDTLPMQDVPGVLGDLWHPRFMRETEKRMARLQQRPNPAPGLAIGRFFLSLEQGKLAAALGALEHPTVAGGIRPFGLLMTVHELDLPVPEGRLDQALAFGPADTVPTPKLYFAAAWAAEQGRWDEFERAVARAETHAERYRAAGDSAGERFTRGMLRAMEGVAAWRRGKVNEAITLLEVGQREATGYGVWGAVNNSIRFTLGRLHLENGRPREALRYFQSFDEYSPISNYYLGLAHEAAGDRDEARAAYELFLDGWRHADRDPAVQAKVAEARAGLGRLGFRPRG